LALKADAEALDRLLCVDQISLPDRAERNSPALLLSVDKHNVEVRWLATDLERAWAHDA
jgi:hypothetical protein